MPIKTNACISSPKECRFFSPRVSLSAPSWCFFSPPWRFLEPHHAVTTFPKPPLQATRIHWLNKPPHYCEVCKVVEWFGSVWNGSVRCGLHGPTQSVRSGLVWPCPIWSDLVWVGLIWADLAWVFSRVRIRYEVAVVRGPSAPRYSYVCSIPCPRAYRAPMQSPGYGASKAWCIQGHGRSPPLCKGIKKKTKSIRHFSIWFSAHYEHAFCN